MRRPLAALLGLLALVAALIAVVSPTERSHEVITWRAAQDNPTAVSLVDPRPATIEVDGRAPARADSDLLDTFVGDPAMRVERPSAHLRIEQRSNALVMAFVGHEGDTLAESSPLAVSAGDPWRLRWDSASATATLTTSSGDQSLMAPAGRIIVLNWLASSDLTTTATVISSGFSLDRPTAVHGLAILLALVLVLGAVVLSGELRRPSTSTRRLREILRPTAPDAFVGVVLVIGAFVLPPNYDDGWYLARSRLLAASGWSLQTPLSDPYWGGVPNIQGFLYESVLGHTVAQSTVVVVIRLLPLILLGATWFVLSRWVLPRLAGAGWPRWVGAGLIALWAASFLTLRPEVFVGLLAAMLVTVFPRSGGRLVVVPMVAAVGLTALAVSTHQTGLVLAPLAVLALGVCLWRSAPIFLKVAGLSAGLALALALGFINQNLTLAIEDLRGYDALTGHGAGPLDEWLRVAELLRIGTFGQRAFTAVAAVGLVALALVTLWRWGRRLGSIEDRLLITGVVLMPAGLLATSSKWSWHYAVLIVPCIVGVAVAVNAAQVRLKSVRSRIVFSAAGSLLLLMVMWFAAGSYSVDAAWRKVILTFGIIAICIAVVAGWRRGAAGIAGLLGVGLAIGVLGVPLAQGIKAAQDSPTGYSFLAQTTRGVVDAQYRCGAIGFVGPVGGPEAPTGADLVASGASMTVGPGQYLVNPCTPIWTRSGGLWDPIDYSIEDPNWLLANLPVQPDPPSGCITRATPDLNGNYESCVFGLRPARPT